MNSHLEKILEKPGITGLNWIVPREDRVTSGDNFSFCFIYIEIYMNIYK